MMCAGRMMPLLLLRALAGSKALGSAGVGTTAHMPARAVCMPQVNCSSCIAVQLPLTAPAGTAVAAAAAPLASAAAGRTVPRQPGSFALVVMQVPVQGVLQDGVERLLTCCMLHQAVAVT
jgi:hypothetical protein